MMNKPYKAYTFDSYENPDDTIVAAADDFNLVYGCYPNILFASQYTFDRMCSMQGLKMGLRIDKE
jgi:hypothetical protein